MWSSILHKNGRPRPLSAIGWQEENPFQPTLQQVIAVYSSAYAGLPD